MSPLVSAECDGWAGPLELYWSCICRSSLDVSGPAGWASNTANRVASAVPCVPPSRCHHPPAAKAVYLTCKDTVWGLRVFPALILRPVINTEPAVLVAGTAFAAAWTRTVGCEVVTDISGTWWVGGKYPQNQVEILQHYPKLLQHIFLGKAVNELGC